MTADHLGSLASCIEKLGANCLDEAKLTAIFELLKKLLAKHFEKAKEREGVKAPSI